MKILNRYTGEIILEIDSLIGANLSHANLRDTNLRDTNLSGTNLSHANLSHANLFGANLSGANLRGANLSHTDLSHTDLSHTDLSGANLIRANLWGCIGNMREIKTAQFEMFKISYTKDRIQIGCKNHSITDWWNFTNSQISEMDFNALKWWKKWKGVIKNIIEISPAI